jgi:hypothetical protein
MPTRIIRDGILTSERVNMLTALEEVFYRRLMSVVDDYGRFYGNHSLIRAACFPLKLEKVSDSDIGKWLQVTEKAGLVRQYQATDGKRYLELQDFGQRIQAKSKFPEPGGYLQKPTVGNCEAPDETVLNGLVVDEVVDEVVNTRARKPRLAKSALPDNFGISERVKAWATEKGHNRLTEHLEAFRAKAMAKGYTYVDWDSAFMEAIRNDWASLGNQQKSTVDNGSSPASQRAL